MGWENTVPWMYIKNCVIKKLKNIDISIAPHVKAKLMKYIILANKLYLFKGSKSKLYYQMLIQKKPSGENMESIFAWEFKFEHSANVWKNVYNLSGIITYTPNSEFNFKVVHNIMPNANVLSKWKNYIVK